MHLTNTQHRALIAAARGPISTRGQAGRFKRETLTALADLGLVEIENVRVHRSGEIIYTSATITASGRQALAALPPRPRRPLRAAVAFAALLAGCGTYEPPFAPPPVACSLPRRPCVPDKPETCRSGLCVPDAHAERQYVCLGQEWPYVCEFHPCRTDDASTCVARGGVCVAVDGPWQGCCLYPSAPASLPKW